FSKLLGPPVTAHLSHMSGPPCGPCLRDLGDDHRQKPENQARHEHQPERDDPRRADCQAYGRWPLDRREHRPGDAEGACPQALDEEEKEEVEGRRQVTSPPGGHVIPPDFLARSAPAASRCTVKCPAASSRFLRGRGTS